MLCDRNGFTRRGLEHRQNGSASSEASALCAMSSAKHRSHRSIDQLISASLYANRVRLISPNALGPSPRPSPQPASFSGNSYTVRSALNASAFFRPQRSSTEHPRMFTGTFGLHRAPSGAHETFEFHGHPSVSRNHPSHLCGFVPHRSWILGPNCLFASTLLQGLKTYQLLSGATVVT
jgi:hypothetical protein